MKLLKKLFDVFGPHELVALVAFSTTVLVWGVTLRVLFYGD